MSCVHNDSMIESRGLIESVEKAKDAVEKIGGTFKSNYRFKDVIFVPQRNNCNLNDDVVRVRVYVKSDWPTKKVVVVRKQATFTGMLKKDHVVIKEAFDSEKEAVNFVKKHISEFQYGFEYVREGWEYSLGDCRIFIEDIEGYQPSMEVEANDEKIIRDLFRKIGVNTMMKESVPEIMRRRLKLR